MHHVTLCMYVCVGTRVVLFAHIPPCSVCVCACLGRQQIAMCYESQSASCAPDVPKVFFKCWRRWWWGWCGVCWWTSLRGWDLLNPSRFGLLLFFFPFFCQQRWVPPPVLPLISGIVEDDDRAASSSAPPSMTEEERKTLLWVVWME